MGGISPAVSREQLEEEFSKFGKIDDFKFLRDRNTAFVEYVRLEDASQALRMMNGKRIGGDQIRVDFLRSQPVRRVSFVQNLNEHQCFMFRYVCSIYKLGKLTFFCIDFTFDFY